MKVFLTLFFFIVLITVGKAQWTNNHNVRPHSGRAVVSDSVVSQRFKRLCITEKKLEELKAIGVDLRYQLTQSHSPDERVDAAMTPIVIVGKVLSIRDFHYTLSSSLPDTSHPFLSEVNVQIIDLLKGPKNTGRTIQLMRQSGVAIYKGHEGETFISTDPVFTVGDTSVFYLSEIDHSSLLTALYKNYFSKRKLENASPAYWVRDENKHNIHNSVVDYYGYYIPVDSFKVEIKNVANIVDKP